MAYTSTLNGVTQERATELIHNLFPSLTTISVDNYRLKDPVCVLLEDLTKVLRTEPSEQSAKRCKALIQQNGEHLAVKNHFTEIIGYDPSTFKLIPPQDPKHHYEIECSVLVVEVKNNSFIFEEQCWESVTDLTPIEKVCELFGQELGDSASEDLWLCYQSLLFASPDPSTRNARIIYLWETATKYKIMHLVPSYGALIAGILSSVRPKDPDADNFFKAYRFPEELAPCFNTSVFGANDIYFGSDSWQLCSIPDNIKEAVIQKIANGEISYQNALSVAQMDPQFLTNNADLIVGLINSDLLSNLLESGFGYGIASIIERFCDFFNANPQISRDFKNEKKLYDQIIFARCSHDLEKREGLCKAIEELGY